MGRPSNKEERRQQIVNALLECISEHGYEKSTIQIIAKHAGLSSGLIHHHFKNKQEILVALAGQLVTHVHARYETLAKKAVTDNDRLNAFVDAHLALGKGSSAQSVAAWVVIGAEAIRQEEVREVYEKAITQRQKELMALLKKVLGKGVANKEVSKLAATILSTMEGAYQLSSTVPSILPKGFAADMVKKTIGGFLSKDRKL